jgi:hypothetical protein
MANLFASHIRAVLLIAGLISMLATGCAIQAGDVIYKRFQRKAIERELGKIEMKSFSVVVLLLLSSCLARSAPITDVSLGRWQYDAGGQQVSVPITNNSQKTITAFNLSLKVTAGGQVSEYQTGHDFLGNRLLQEHYQDTPKEAFGTASIPPGKTYMERIAVPMDFESISVALDMVAFSDRTAEADNVGALDRLIEQRKAIAASIEKVNGASADQVHKVKEDWKAQEHQALTEDEGQYMIIEQELNQTPPESLKDYWAWKQKEKTVWLEQSQLRLVRP